MDAIACESHFLDHLAPVWRLLQPPYRGHFYTAPELVQRARDKGIEAEAIDVRGIQRTPQKPPNVHGQPALIASIGDAKIGRRIGYGPFAFLEHGAGQTYGNGNSAHSSYAGGPERQDHELVMVPNEYAASHWRKSYPRARVEIVGCPKLDNLPHKEPGPLTVAISFHWPAPLTVSGYAGTACGDFLTALPALAKAFNVIGHAHPKADWQERMTRHYAKAGIPFVAEFDDVCRQADVYVCDNSSTIFEFAATGRPVVLMNARYWSRKHSLGLRFWDAAHVGINVDRHEDLIAAVHEALADAPERQRDREDALRFVYPVRSGGAELAAAAITDWLANRLAVAA